MKEEIQKFFKGDIDSQDETRRKYAHDASLFEVKPELVLFPKDTADIQNLVRWAIEAKKRFPNLSITARAAGTCMAGGPLNNSIILDTTRFMNSVREIKRVPVYQIKPLFEGSRPVEITGEAIVEPGCFYRDFEKKAQEQNLLLPCFTASKTINALGGMVGNNSGGELTLRYGKTEDYVKELKVIFSDGNEYTVKALSEAELETKIAQNNFEGSVYKQIRDLISANKEIIETAKPKVSKNSAGYFLWNVETKNLKGETIFDIGKIIIGSQGTLGIVTEITLRLVTPKKHEGLLVAFLYGRDDLGKIVDDALTVEPETIEAYDDKTILLAVKFWYGFIKKRGLWGALMLGLRFIPEVRMLLSGTPKLVLLIDCSSDEENSVVLRLQKLNSLLSKYKNLKTRIVFSKTAAEKYWIIRHDSFALLREHFQGKRTAPFIDDVIVRPEFLPEFLPKLIKILDDNKLIYNMHGHAANGNFHIIPLIDQNATLSQDLILKISNDVYGLVLSYHGSITAEHNDGIIRTPFLEQMYGPIVYGLFKTVKEIFDPQVLFNPKKKVGGTIDDLKSHLIGGTSK